MENTSGLEDRRDELEHSDNSKDTITNNFTCKTYEIYRTPLKQLRKRKKYELYSEKMYSVNTVLKMYSFKWKKLDGKTLCSRDNTL